MSSPVLLHVDEMFCTSCSRAVETVLGRQEGVASARVGFATRVASLEVEAGADREAVERAAIEAATALGYPARPWVFRPGGLEEDDDDGLQELGLRLAMGWFFGMWVMAAQLALYLDPSLPSDAQVLLARVAGVFATPVVFVVGARFHLAGWRTVRAGVPGMDVLVSLGSVGAWLLSVVELWSGSSEVWFDAATMLIVLLLAGRLLEARARAKGVNAVRELLDLTPERVALRTDHGVEEVVAATVEPGAVVEVPAGARVPLDGTVVSGRSTIDRSLLTGESEAVSVGMGDAVEAGCINGGGPLAVEVTAGVGSRVLDGIATQVRTALDQRAEVPGFAQRLSERAVPYILGLAVLTFVGVWGWTGSVDGALLRALTVLVVTCPCALGVAAPLVRVVAIGRAARKGVLFRDGDALERAGGVDVVVLDKTGTLTRGRPSVVEVQALPGWTEGQVRRLAAGAETGSDHPIGRAVRAAAPRHDEDGEREVLHGQGVVWRREAGEVRVGSRAWLAPDAPRSVERPWATEVWVAVDDQLAGCLRLVDEVRPDARATIERLRSAGLELALWSGDAAGPVAHVAAAVGLPPEVCRAGRTPLGKAQLVAELEAAGRRVAFVGDGVNDAPALAAATVGVAVEGATDAARAAADVVIRAHGLPQVAEALLVAEDAARRARANVAWALTYNALAVPLAVVGWIRPEFAALAMVLSSLSVTLNATRGGGRALWTTQPTGRSSYGWSTPRSPGWDRRWCRSRPGR